MDFDGVLHSFSARDKDRTELFLNLPRLEAVLRDFPEVRVVISSTWRETHSIEELTSHFSKDIAGRVIGALPVIEISTLSELEFIRFREIKRFLRENKCGQINWLALDDDSTLFPTDCPNLIQCDDGFGAEEERKLRRALCS